MDAPSRWRPVFFLLGMSLFLLLAGVQGSHGQGGAAKKKDAKKKDEHYQNLLKQLQARFRAWDTNGDNVLDKAELAKAFRGGQAKPYDADPPKKDTAKKDVKDVPTTPAKSKVRPIALALLALPRGGMPVNMALAEVLSLPPKPAEPKEKLKEKPKDSSPKANPAVLQYGDFQFLAVVNKTSDDKITRAEFDAWSKQYAKMLDHYDDAEHEVKEAKSHLAKAKTPQARKLVEADLARHLKEFQQVSAQLNAISPLIHKALNVKH